MTQVFEVLWVPWKKAEARLWITLLCSSGRGEMSLKARWAPSGLDNAVGLSDSGPGNRCRWPGLELSHPLPQPPRWAVAWSLAALSSRLSKVSHLRVQMESPTARRGRVSDHSQGGQQSPLCSLLAVRPVTELLCEATLLGMVLQESGIALAQETYLEVPPEADQSAHQVLPCPMSLSF